MWDRVSDPVLPRSGSLSHMPGRSKTRPHTAEAASYLLQSCFSCGLQQFLRVTCWIAFTEHSVACHQNFGARTHYFGHRIQSDSPIDFNPIIKPPLLAQFSQFPDLVHDAWDKFLSAEPRIDRHNQHIIDDVQHFAQSLNRRRGVNYDARKHVVASNQVQRPVQMYAGFLVYGNPIGSCIREVGDVLIRIFDHQVAIQRQISGISQ